MLASFKGTDVDKKQLLCVSVLFFGQFKEAFCDKVKMNAHESAVCHDGVPFVTKCVLLSLDR